ncbi:MAG TPA: hypothetical protein VL993_14835 [Stellaceae bacterium]|nr:hypothetical protein [Stellaceae bacterium]
MCSDQNSSDDAARRFDKTNPDAPKKPLKPHARFIGKSAPPPRREPKGSSKKGR